MGKHFSHLTQTKRIQIDAFLRAGMKPVDIAKELGVHYTTIYREIKRSTYEHTNSDLTTETRYNPDGAQARYEENLRAKGPDLKLGNDYELANYLIAKIRDEKYSPDAAIGEAELKGWRFRVHICAATVYKYIRAASAWRRSGQKAPQPDRRPARASRRGTRRSRSARPSATGKWTASRAAKASKRHGSC